MARRSQDYFRSIICVTSTRAVPPEVSFTSVNGSCSSSAERNSDYRRRIVERIDERRRNLSVERQTHGVTDQRALHDEKRKRCPCHGGALASASWRRYRAWRRSSRALPAEVSCVAKVIKGSRGSASRGAKAASRPLRVPVSASTAPAGCGVTAKAAATRR